MKRSFLSHTDPVPASRGLALTVSSVALIAATYGMARFGVGLLHPQMASARPSLQDALRPAGTAQFASYCVSVLIGGQLAQTRGRAVAAAAGLSAGIGCVGLLLAQSPTTFTMAAFIAGSGAGLASPALVPLLDRAVPVRWSATTQTAVNSGTAVGLIISGSLVLITTGITMPWALIAVMCVAAGTAVWFFAPSGIPREAATSESGDGVRLVVPVSLAGVVGIVSAFVWTYGPSVIVQHGLISTGGIGWLWVAVGLGGLLAVFTSQLVDRTGPLVAFLLSTSGIALATAGVALATQPWLAIASLALFGAAYMALSGILILWGRLLRPSNGGQATAWLFLALAVGQALGAATIATP